MKIQVCTWKACKSRFSEYILKRISDDSVKFELSSSQVTAETCPCLWHCKEWPNVLIDGKIQHYSDPIKISKMMFEKIKQKRNPQQKK